MKRTFFSIILAWAFINCHAQRVDNFTISNEKNNFVYKGLDSPLKAFADECPCESLILTSDNGNISSYGNCYFSWIPAKTGSAFLSLKRIAKKDTILIGKQQFFVKGIPEPVLYLLNKDCGALNKSLLSLPQALIPSYRELDIDINVPVKSYKLIVLRDTSVMFIQNIKGNSLSKEFNNCAKTLKSGDVLIFSQVTIKLPDGSLQILRPSEFTIE